jgi:hypothetical protein
MFIVNLSPRSALTARVPRTAHIWSTVFCICLYFTKRRTGKDLEGNSRGVTCTIRVGTRRNHEKSVVITQARVSRCKFLPFRCLLRCVLVPAISVYKAKYLDVRACICDAVPEYWDSMLLWNVCVTPQKAVGLSLLKILSLIFLMCMFASYRVFHDFRA